MTDGKGLFSERLFANREAQSLPVSKNKYWDLSEAGVRSLQRDFLPGISFANS